MLTACGLVEVRIRSCLWEPKKNRVLSELRTEEFVSLEELRGSVAAAAEDPWAPALLPGEWESDESTAWTT